MTPLDIVRYRLTNQALVNSPLQTAADVVQHLGAMQAQEYAQAKWAISLRAPHLTDATLEAAFSSGAILRTHVLRPTWHFVAPADIRWLLALTGPRVQAGNALMCRKLELDAATLTRSLGVLTTALANHHYSTRSELQTALARAGIDASGQRLAYLLMHAELTALICSGPRQGKQFTYALLDERAPVAPAFTRDEALAALTRRYFTSRAPATLADFTWWSGLTIKDARAGLTLLGDAFGRTLLDGQEYVVPAAWPAPAPLATFLMPDYDEYGISYRARGALFSPALAAGLTVAKNGTMPHLLVLDGVVAGTWQRPATLKDDVTVTFFAPPTTAQRQAVAAAVAHYRRFIGRT